MVEEMMEIFYRSVIRHFVPSVLLREENYQAYEEERSQYTSMVIMKPLRCISAH